jgi:hypothetical protein
MTPEQFLADLVSFYGANPNRRSITSKGKCYYGPMSTSPGCQIGRYLLCSDEEKRELDKTPVSYRSLVAKLQSTGRLDIIPNWMLKLDQEFVEACQHLHDASWYWGNVGLSASGEDEVKRILDSFDLSEQAYLEALAEKQTVPE